MLNLGQWVICREANGTPNSHKMSLYSMESQIWLPFSKQIANGIKDFPNPKYSITFINLLHEFVLWLLTLQNLYYLLTQVLYTITLRNFVVPMRSVW